MNRKWVSGHNFKAFPKSPEHCRRISEAQKRAWQTKRQRLPLGSKNKDPQGYIRVKVHQGKGEWPKEHTLIMEKRIGRKLTDKEVVHHIDGDRANNRDSNLYLCRDRDEHQRIERQIKETFRDMLKRGIVTFNHLLGVYQWQ